MAIFKTKENMIRTTLDLSALNKIFFSLSDIPDSVKEETIFVWDAYIKKGEWEILGLDIDDKDVVTVKAETMTSKGENMLNKYAFFLSDEQKAQILGVKICVIGK